MEEYMLQTEQLSKTYQGVPVLDQVSIKLQQGHIYGFIGNNGAGKTTFMRIIGGLCKPTGGTWELFGGRDRKSQERGRRRVGFLIEHPIFYPDMSAFQNLMIQAGNKGIREKGHVQELLELVELKDVGKKRVKDFSTGMKQRYGIAFALLGWPELLILDEPLNGMDIPSMDKIMELLEALWKEKNTTIFLSSHLLGRLYPLATDFLFLHQGKLIQSITSKELKDQIGETDIEEYFRQLTGTERR